MAKDTALSAAMATSPNKLHRMAYEKAKREGSLYEFEDGKFPQKLRLETGQTLENLILLLNIYLYIGIRWIWKGDPF